MRRLTDLHTSTSRSTSNAAATGSDAVFRYSFYRSIDAAGQDWDTAAPGHDLFLQRSYLSVIERNPPEGMRFGYILFYKGNDPIGVALCQLKYFKADENINDLDTPEKEPCFFNGLASWLKRWVAGRVAADIMICGNMLLTGEHAYYFDYHKIAPNQSVELLEEALSDFIAMLEREGSKISFVLVKDVAPTHHQHGASLVKKNFVEFEIQPSMEMDLPYRDFDEYLSSMSTKYRTRAKRAFKKGSEFERKELSATEAQRELPKMYDLYKEVAKNAGFNMVDLNENYLVALKKDLPNNFRIFAYYFEGQLIAFYTTLQNGDEMEAHFLGYDKERNHDMQIYLNILYDIIRVALESGCTRLVFARTALEIKSSVGAKAYDYCCYLRNQNQLLNKFTATLLDYLKPVEEWMPRHPFKTAEEF